MRKPSSHPTLFPALMEDPAPAPIPKRAPRPPAAPAPEPVKAAAAPATKPAKALLTAASPKAITTAKSAKIVATPKPAKITTAKAAKIAAAPKQAKTIPVQAAAPMPPAPVRVVTETNGAGGRAWRMSSRYAIAYIKDAALAGELLATDARHLAKIAMAVYYDRKGKAFAWQVRFDAARWDEVVRRLA